MTKKYKADDNDLPPIFHEPAPGISPIATAKMRIHNEAKALDIELTPEEVQKFAILFVAMQEE